MSARDVESVQPEPRERSRCMDTFLLSSVIILFVLVLSGGAVGFWVVKDLRASLKPGFDGTFNKLVMHPGNPSANLGTSYKTQDFAYLRANNNSVRNISMHWGPVNYANTSSIGSRYRYDGNHHSLTVKMDGTYFLYVQLNVTCAADCADGSLTVTFEDDKQNNLLTCSLHLRFPGPAVHKCWTVIPHFPGGTRLMAQMHTTVVSKNYWHLDMNRSGFGMFLVGGPEAP